MRSYEQGDVAFLDKATNDEEEVLFAAIKTRLKSSPGWYRKNAESIRGVTEETTTGVHHLYDQRIATGEAARQPRGPQPRACGPWDCFPFGSQ